MIDGIAVMGPMSFLLFRALLAPAVFTYSTQAGPKQLPHMIDADSSTSQTVLHTVLHTLMCLLVAPPLYQVG